MIPRIVLFRSQLRRAVAREQRGDPWQEVLAEYLEAHENAPHRPEPLCRVAQHYRDEKNHALSFLFARRAYELPAQDALDAAYGATGRRGPPDYDRDGLITVADLVAHQQAVYWYWVCADLVAVAARHVGEWVIGLEAARRAHLHGPPGNTRLLANFQLYREHFGK